MRGGETTINRLDRDDANRLMVRLIAPIGIRGRLFSETGEMLGAIILRLRKREYVAQGLIDAAKETEGVEARIASLSILLGIERPLLIDLDDAICGMERALEKAHRIIDGGEIRTAPGF